MKKSIVGLFTAGFIALAVTPAVAQTYDIALYDGTSTIVDGTGSFTYSGGTFSNFTVSWNGLVANFTNQANLATSVGGCGGGAGVAAFDFLLDKNNCDTLAPAWMGSAFKGDAGGTGISLSPDLTKPGGFAAYGDTSDGHGGIDTTTLTGNPINFGLNSQGFVQSGGISVTAAPEIDPTSAMSALTLLFGSILVLQSRKQRNAGR